MKHSTPLLSAADADKAMAFAVVFGALLVIILLARAVVHLSKRHVPAPPPPAPKKSGGGGKFLLAAAGAIGGWVLWDRHENSAAAVKAAPAPAPSPTPTVTRTLAPHVTAPVHLPLTGTQILIMLGIAAVVAIVLIGPLLRRST